MVGIFLLLMVCFLNPAFGANPAKDRHVTPNTQDSDKHQYTEFTRELFQSRVVYPQIKGGAQLAAFPQYHNGYSSDDTEFPLVAEYGLTDSWLLEASWDSFVIHNAGAGKKTSGISDWAIATQYSFMHFANTTNSAAIGFEIQFPSGSINKKLTDGLRVYEPYFILTKDLPNLANIQIFSELGVGFVERVLHHANPSDDKPTAHEVIFNAGFFGPVGSVVYSLEFNLRNNQWNSNGHENELYLTPGLALNVSKRFEIGLGVPIGLNNTTDHYRVIGLLVVEL